MTARDVDWPIMGSIIPLIALGLIVLLAWACLVTVVRACTLPRGVVKGGSCGRCGYEYSGWAICPECGGPVGDVGVTTPRLAMRYRGSLANAGIALIFFAVALGFILTTATLVICQSVGWTQHVRQTGYTSQVRPPDMTQLPGMRFIVHWDVAGTSPDKARGGEILLLVDPVSGSGGVSTSRPSTFGLHHVLIDVKSGRFEVFDDRGAKVGEGEGLGVSDVQALITRAGIVLEPNDLETAAFQLVRVVDTGNAAAMAALGPGKSYNSPVLGETGTAMMTNPSLPFPVLGGMGPRAVTGIAAVVSGIVLVVAFVIVVRRRRRLLKPVVVRRLSSLAE